MRNYYRYRMLTLSIALLSVFFIGMDAIAATLPFAKGEHPRIIITQADIPAIAAKVDEPTDPMYQRYMAMKNDVDAAISNNWVWEYINGPTSEVARCRVVSAAFVYLVENYLHPDSSSFYVNGVKQVLENTDSNHYTGYSYPLQSFAIAYDWIYNGLSSADRIIIGNKLMNSYAIQQDPNNRGTGEWALDAWHIMMSNLPSCEWTFAAIAIWNETDLSGNADNSIAQTRLDRIRKFLVDKKMPYTNMVGGGINPEGFYDDTGYFAMEIIAWDKATGENLWDTSMYLKENLITRLFAWKIYTDKWVPFGMWRNEHNAIFSYGVVNILSNSDINMHSKLANIDTGRIAQYLANEQFNRGIQIYWNENWLQYLWIIYYDPTKPSTHYNTLPTAYYAQGYNADGTAPLSDKLDAGWVFFRSGWTKDDTLVAFTSGDWFSGKQLYNVNAFSIYRSGDLATMNNQDQYTGGKDPVTGKVQNYTFQMNYGKPSVAVNSITVSDPNVAMDQGQELYNVFNLYGAHPDAPHHPYPGPTDEKVSYFNPTTFDVSYPNETFNPVLSEHVKGAKYIDRGDIVKYETTDYYDYVVGDGAKAYHPDRLTNFQRALAFLGKKYIVILDRVTAAKPEYVKRWYLHTVKEPVIPGNALTNTSSVNGSTTWSQADFNNLYVDSDPAGGRLFVKSLLPDGATYRKRGGEGFFFWRNDRSWNPEPGSQADNSDSMFEGRKGWRLEQDVSGQAYDMFLNVLYPTDSTVSSMPETVRISQADGNLTTDKMVGAHIKDGAENMLVLLSSDPDGAAVTSNFEVTVEATTEKVKGFVFDTDPAIQYDIIRSGSTTAQTFIITPGSGILSAGIEVLEHTEKGTLVFTAEIPPLNRRYCSVDALR